jgi:hypothetical protein
MVDHIYGRGTSLVSPHRPHMFASEIVMYVDYFDNLIKHSGGTSKEISKLTEFCKNLRDGMNYCLEIAKGKAYIGEDLESLVRCVREQGERLSNLLATLVITTAPLATPA